MIAHVSRVKTNFAPTRGGSHTIENRYKRLTVTAVDELLAQAELALAVKSNLAVLRCLEEQIERIEEVVLAQLKLREGFAPLLTVSGTDGFLGPEPG